MQRCDEWSYAAAHLSDDDPQAYSDPQTPSAIYSGGIDRPSRLRKSGYLRVIFERKAGKHAGGCRVRCSCFATKISNRPPPRKFKTMRSPLNFFCTDRKSQSRTARLTEILHVQLTTLSSPLSASRNAFVFAQSRIFR